MRESDAAHTTREIALVVLIFSVGYGSLMTVSLWQGSATNGGSGISMLVSLGTALACYLMLRPPFAVWHQAHASVPLSSWLSAAGTALLFTLVTMVGVMFVGLLAALVGALAGWPDYWLPKGSG
jgi:hypothetical protein